MQEVVSNVDNVIFDIEVALEEQRGAIALPFPGMDKSGAAICTFYMRSQCAKGTACPFRHVKGDREIVCKHWLRGLCKKGDDCEFLHEYDMSKMPECYFYSKFGQCSNKECPFLHIDPESKMIDCPWYDRGFCRHGPNCKNRHVRRVMCPNYLCGFCPEGKNCKFMHPKFDIPVTENMEKKKQVIICHYCGEFGHKAISCFKAKNDGINPSELIPPGNPVSNFTSGAGVPKTMQTSPLAPLADRTNQNPGFIDPSKPPDMRGYLHQFHPFHRGLNKPYGQRFQNPGTPRGPRLPREAVVCYKCGDKGHFANRCPKGHLAFLSNPRNLPGYQDQQGDSGQITEQISYGWGH